MSLNIQHLREPASALTHGLWFLASIPLIIRLMRKTSDRSKQFTILLYGLTLLACSGASTVFHSVQGSESTLAWYNRLDHIGIGLLIAGTYTPIAFHLLHAKSGKQVLSLIWAAAIAAALLRIAYNPIPKGIATSIYLAMGWGAVPGYALVCQRVPWNKTRMIAEGGLFYTFGALLHWQDAPNLIPGIFEAHDLFHLMVMAGSFRHYQFIEQTVLPSFDPECLGANLGFALTAPIAEPSEPATYQAIRKPFLWMRKSNRQQMPQS